jgi:hypothetical protein
MTEASQSQVGGLNMDDVSEAHAAEEQAMGCLSRGDLASRQSRSLTSAQCG